MKKGAVLRVNDETGEAEPVAFDDLSPDVLVFL